MSERMNIRWGFSKKHKYYNTICKIIVSEKIENAQYLAEKLPK